MFKLEYTGAFKRDLKRIKKRSPKDLKLIENFIVESLQVSGANGLDKKSGS